MTPLVVAVFIAVYLGMALGRIPGLKLDRTGVALLGLIVLLAAGAMTLDEWADSVDLPTIALLFALMIVSAQFRGSGFYRLSAGAVTAAAGRPARLLAILIAVTGGLSAVLTNDVVVFALTPLIITGLLDRGLDPRPFLIALAGAANAGSAATLIGNPQNILIGQVGGLDFWRYAALAIVPTVAALAAVYGAVGLGWRDALAKPAQAAAAEAVDIDRWQVAKGAIALVGLIGLFATPLPREIGALAVAGVLLLSRRMASRDMIGSVDWHLLLLFACLFGVTAAFAQTGLSEDGLAWLGSHGLDPQRLSVLGPLALALSNSIGNVPAVVLFTMLLPDLGEGWFVALALLTTFAGNLLLTGSMCNIIVAERAARVGVRLTFTDFARSGIPMTLAAMAAAVAWLSLTGLAAF
jgi:Na+/H+ antiporter NhaD/arsenite permease-like protein